MHTTKTAAIVAALSISALTACTPAGAGTDFCDVSANIDVQTERFDGLELSDEAFEAAIAGDMSGINEWGAEAGDALADMSAEIERAKGGAPSDEVSAALDTTLEAFGLFAQLATSAESATDFLAFYGDIEEITPALEDVSARMDAATDVLDDAELEYCS